MLANLAALSCLRAADFQPETLPLGSPAPDFNLTGVDGHTYTLKDFADAKILVVIFTCDHCPTAQYYEERLKQLVTDYKDSHGGPVSLWLAHTHSQVSDRPPGA